MTGVHFEPWGTWSGFRGGLSYLSRVGAALLASVGRGWRGFPRSSSAQNGPVTVSDLTGASNNAEVEKSQLGSSTVPLFSPKLFISWTKIINSQVFLIRAYKLV